MREIRYLELFLEMKKNGDSQKSLAKILGITQQSISRKLSGKSEWTISEVEKLCEYYDKDFYQLFKKREY